MIVDKMNNDPARIAIAIAKSLTPSARVLNALALRTFEKLFTTLATLFKIFGTFFVDSSRTSPAPERTFPTPSAGLRALSTISDNRLSPKTTPTPIPLAMTLLQLTPCNLSSMSDPRFLKKSTILSFPDVRPFQRPERVYSPTFSISFEGE